MTDTTDLTINLTFRASEDLVARIEAFAKEARRSRSDAIRMLCDERLSDLARRRGK